MGHFEKGRYVEELDMIEQLFGFKVGEKYEDPHTKTITKILEHINTRIAPSFKELAGNVNELNGNVNELNKRLNKLEGKNELIGNSE